jgi:hypothetical protein
MIDENYCGLVFKKLDAKTTKAYFKRDRLYIEGNEFIHRSNITQETAIHYVNGYYNYRMSESHHLRLNSYRSMN